MTQAVFRQSVPAPVIVVPASPAPAATLVTVPVHCVMVDQVNPVVQVEQAARTWPFVPTDRAVGVEAAEADSKSPFAVKAVQETKVGVAHFMLTLHPVSTVST